MIRKLTIIVGLLVATSAPAAAGGGGGCNGPFTDGAGTSVEISSLCFTPTVVRVDPGDTVTWTNADSIEHNVYSTGFDGRATFFGKGGSYQVTFTDVGVFPYVCSIHPGMMGAVIVGDADVPSVAAAPAAAPPAAEAAAPVVAPAPVDPAMEQRLAAIEAAVLAPASESPSWPPLIIGLLAGLVLAGLILRGRPAS